ncbi:hypothetical protein KL923_001158 [Ogataea haglerorum]|nr:hypothetical protein KL923_001158 [Ogataea haglerorum]
MKEKKGRRKDAIERFIESNQTVVLSSLNQLRYTILCEGLPRDKGLCQYRTSVERVCKNPKRRVPHVPERRGVQPQSVHQCSDAHTKLARPGNRELRAAQLDWSTRLALRPGNERFGGPVCVRLQKRSRGLCPVLTTGHPLHSNVYHAQPAGCSQRCQAGGHYITIDRS